MLRERKMELYGVRKRERDRERERERERVSDIKIMYSTTRKVFTHVYSILKLKLNGIHYIHNMFRIAFEMPINCILYVLIFGSMQ